MPVVDTALSGRSEPVEYEPTPAECFENCLYASICRMQYRRQVVYESEPLPSRMWADLLECSQQCEYFED